jgi:hypothetical protein
MGKPHRHSVAADAHTNHSTHLFLRYRHPDAEEAVEAGGADVTGKKAAGRHHPDRLSGLFWFLVQAEMQAYWCASAAIETKEV